MAHGLLLLGVGVLLGAADYLPPKIADATKTVVGVALVLVGGWALISSVKLGKKS